jgi:ankyrin repeat protein
MAANLTRRARTLGKAMSLAPIIALACAAGFDAHAAGVAAAARNADIGAVRAQIAAGANVNEPEVDGTSALLWAAYQSSPELVKLLLDAGADPNVANEFGVTPLLQAARYGDFPTVQALLAGGADIARAEREGETPLMAAARAGSVPTVKLLIERGAAVNSVDALGGQTALMWAAAEGHIDVVSALLEAGADPNIKSRVSDLKQRSMRADFPSGGFTALMWAARNGDEALVRRLIAGGADLKLANGDGATAMMLAIVNDRFDMAAKLLELGADANDGSLYYAVEMRDATTDLRARDGSRLRPDHPNDLTALDLIARLLDAGADPDQPYIGQMHSATMCCDVQGEGTPFFRAAIAADVEALKLMVAHGADPNWTAVPVEGAMRMPFADHTGMTPLMVAVNGGQGVLMAGGPGDIREGAAPPFREKSNRNPADAVRVLLAAGANPDAKSSRGTTALHVAAHDGRLEVIRALVEGGASLDVKNADGLTALQVIEKMPVRKQDPLAEMVGVIDDGAQPKETVAFMRELIAARAPAGACAR